MRRGLSVLLFLMVLSLLGWWVQSSPAFRASEFDITGLESLSRVDIMQLLGDINDKHMLEIWLRNPQETLLQHPRIKEATIEYQFPSRLLVAIRERRPIALIPYLNHFVSVDDEGKVLRLYLSTHQAPELPLMTGLVLPLLTEGDTLPITSNFLAGARILTQIGTQYRQQLAEVNVSSALQVMLRSNDNILIDVGEGKGLAQKATYLLEILSFVRLHNLKGGTILVGEDFVSYCAPPTVPASGS